MAKVPEQAGGAVACNTEQTQLGEGKPGFNQGN